MSSLSLFGVDLPGNNYQLGYIQANKSWPLFGTWCANAGLVLYNTVTGDFFFADDMPVEIKPGFLLQGRKTKSGDSDVFHGSVQGSVIPDSVLSELGMALPNVANTDNTCFRCINDANVAKQRIYGVNLSSYYLEKYHVVHHEMVTFRAPAVTMGTYSRRVVDGNTILHWNVVNTLYEMDIVITVTGNIGHRKLNYGDSSPNYTQGSRKMWVKTLRTGSVMHSDLAVTTGLNFIPWSKPTSLASITSEMVLTSMGESGLITINGDLIDLDGVSPGNSSWLACYNAVNSMKVIDLQWLEFIRDSYHWKQLIPPLKNLAQLKNPAMWGEIFLWFSYGVRPQTSDTLLIINKAASLGDRPLSVLAKEFAARYVKYGTSYDTNQTFLGLPVSVKCNAKLDLQTRIQPETMLGQLLLVLQSVGLGIDARNLWELIPYSFVVDWFVNTSDMMKWIDSTSFPCWYDLNQAVTSEKKVVVLPVDRYFPGMAGSVTLTSYKRSVSSAIPVQPFELRFTDPSSHWLEASALLITRR